MGAETQHNMLIMVLSYVISVFGSYTALQFAIRIPSATGNERNRWIVGSAIALGGCGIWAMHFIAMLAYNTPVQISYEPLRTLASLLLAIIVVAAGFYIVGNGNGANLSLVIGGVVAGLGVAGMHYLGMTAMVMPATIEWNMGIVFLSLVIAVVAATVALWLAFNLRGNLQRFGSALVMGIAVCGMHYTGMAAVTLLVDENAATVTSPSLALSNEVLAFFIFSITAIILCAFLLISTRSALQARVQEEVVFD